MKYNYDLIRSNRKSIEMSISKDLKLIVRAPNRMSIDDIEKFVLKHEKWIEKHFEIAKKRNETKENCELTDDEIKELRKKATEIIPKRVEYYSNIMGVKPTGIKITSAMSRWGSCSSKNSICFSYRLMLKPMDVIDYVVVHELAHIRVKNHSKAFYQEVEKFMPDYKKRLAKLNCI